MIMSNTMPRADKPKRVRAIIRAIMQTQRRLESCWIGDLLAGAMFLVGMTGMIIICGCLQ